MKRIVRQFNDMPDHYQILIDDGQHPVQVFGEYYSYNDMMKGLDDSEIVFTKQIGYQYTIFDLIGGIENGI